VESHLASSNGSSTEGLAGFCGLLAFHPIAIPKGHSIEVDLGSRDRKK
jgi:hypothetical protein